MSMLDLSKIIYSSYFQGLGNIEPMPEYVFDLPQINATRIGGPAIYSWTIPSSSYMFSIPVERPDLLSSILFSIRDTNTTLSPASSGGYHHSWATSIITDGGTTTDQYLSHFESMRGTYETQIHSLILIPPIGSPAITLDYFNIGHRGMYNASNYAKIVIRSWIDGNNLIVNLQIVGGEISTGVNGDNNPTNKAIAASKFRIKLKHYIAPWNM